MDVLHLQIQDPVNNHIYFVLLYVSSFFFNLESTMTPQLLTVEWGGRGWGNRTYLNLDMAVFSTICFKFSIPSSVSIHASPQEEVCVGSQPALLCGLLTLTSSLRQSNCSFHSTYTCRHKGFHRHGFRHFQ